MTTATEEVKKEKSLEDQYSDIKKRDENLRKLALSLMPAECKSIVEQAKQSGIQPYTVQIGDDFYIYRTINRLEFRKLMMDQSEEAEKLVQQAENQSAGRILMSLRQEETLVQRCVLYPSISQLNIGEYPAGIIETLHNGIMFSSGFNQEPVPIKL
jgi:hypothetical protein